jgi:hypothetical protein
MFARNVNLHDQVQMLYIRLQSARESLFDQTQQPHHRKPNQPSKMQGTIDLKNPHRTIRVGVILLNSSVATHSTRGIHF